MFSRYKYLLAVGMISWMDIKNLSILQDLILRSLKKTSEGIEGAVRNEEE